jgi:hypothetical protein
MAGAGNIVVQQPNTLNPLRAPADYSGFLIIKIVIRNILI